MQNKDFLDRAWPDMCAAYRNVELGQACLALQEAFSVDIPLLLVLCLADKSGRMISQDDLTALIDGSSAWRDTVITPLRQARRAMKHSFGSQSEVALRSDIKRLELEAERLHVLRLVETFPAEAVAGQAAAPSYLAKCGLTDIAAQDFIEIFATAFNAEVAGPTAPN